MKIITKKGAKKTAQELTKIIKAIFRSKGITLKEKELIKIENDFYKTLGGKKNEKKSKYHFRIFNT